MTFRHIDKKNNFQKGSVLLMALIFMVLTSLVAVTIMDSSILEIKMAGNQQFQEDAQQIAEGVAQEIINNANNIDPSKNPFISENYQFNEEICDVSQSCKNNTLFVSQALKDLSFGSVIKYSARAKSKGAVEGVSPEGFPVSSSLFELTVEVNGEEKGLSNTTLIIGIDKQSFLKDMGKQVDNSEGAQAPESTVTAGTYFSG